MKRIAFILIALLTVLISGAQVPQKINTWYEYQRFGVDSLQWIPKDTLKVPAAYSNNPYIACKNNTIYVWSNAVHKWIKGGSAFDSSLANSNLRLTANRTINANNKEFLLDSASHLLIQTGAAGPRLTMYQNSYAELGFYGPSTAVGAVTADEGRIGLNSTDEVVLASTAGNYTITNMRRDSTNNILINIDTATGAVHYIDAADILKQKATFGGAVEYKRTLITSNATLNSTHYYLAVDATSSAVTVSLPAVTTCQGRVYIVKKIDSGSNTVYVAANGAETIDGFSSFPLLSQGKRVTIVAGPTSWEILENN